MKAVAFVILALLFVGIFATAHADGSPFQSRIAGVSRGTIAIYDAWLNDFHYIIRIQVMNVSGPLIGINQTDYSDYGQKYASTTGYIDVGAFNGLYPGFIIAGGMSGGQPYPGDVRSMHLSIFGHIVLGQWRSTLWADESNPNLSLVNHSEWDRQTGLLISYFFSFYGSGQALQLKWTNAWLPSLFWFGALLVVSVLSFVVPILVIIFAWYLLGFFVVGMADWLHMRKVKQKSGPRMGNMMWFQIKIMIIAILITMVIISIFFIVLRVLLR